MLDDPPDRESEEESLLPDSERDQMARQDVDHEDGEDMADLRSHRTDRSTEAVLNWHASPEGEEPRYRVYKRRWFGLMQLVLLNVIVSWDVSNRLISSAYAAGSC